MAVSDDELFGTPVPSTGTEEPLLPKISDDELFGPSGVAPAEQGKWKQPDPAQEESLRAMYEPKARAAATEAGVDPDLFTALVWRESKFDPGATSYVGAAGHTQLMENTAAGLGLTGDDRYDPDKNLKAGATYLAQLMKQFDGNMDLALAAYNAGAGTVRKYKGIPPFKETKEYVKAIKAKYEKYKKPKEVKKGK